MTVPAGGSIETTDRLFAGAKEVEQLDRYSEQYGIPLFDRAVDFGWFYFLTKPLFHVLHFFYMLDRQLRRRDPAADARWSRSSSIRWPTSPIGR